MFRALRMAHERPSQLFAVVEVRLLAEKEASAAITNVIQVDAMAIPCALVFAFFTALSYSRPVVHKYEKSNKQYNEEGCVLVDQDYKTERRTQTVVKRTVT
jgi:hypothetical protein